VRGVFLSRGWQIANDTWAPSGAAALPLGYYLDVGGQHNEYYWGARFHIPMSFGYQPLVVPALPVTPAPLSADPAVAPAPRSAQHAGLAAAKPAARSAA
jgi:hypothetical protein